MLLRFVYINVREIQAVWNDAKTAVVQFLEP